VLTTQVDVRETSYPQIWEVDAVLADGGAVHIRPIRADDTPAYRAFFAKLSPDTVYLRFFSPKRLLSDDEVEHFTHVDYHDRMAFVAELRDEIIAVGRYDRLSTSHDAEVAFVVADAHQGRGIGSLLLEYLAVYARDLGITRFEADTLAENNRMLGVFEHAGYRREFERKDAGIVRLAFDIEPTGASMAAIEQREWTAGVQSISRILRPRSIAVVGAGRDPSNIGRAVVRNLVRGGYTGAVFPVNRSGIAIDGLPAYTEIESIPGRVDLAVIAVPAAQCLDVVDACGRKDVGGLVVISSGFAETGADGAALQRELLLRAHRGGMRMVGPNCFGVINTASDVALNATFAPVAPTAGTLAFASQSGALGIAVLERSLTSGLGLSCFVSMGNKADVSSNDLLRYWSQDGVTRAILLYLEAFGNARAFARVAPVVSRTKPIVVVKSGRTAAGRRAASSHTAALASPDLAADALFRQAGVIRVDTLEELLDCGALLAEQPALGGNRLLIVGNAGGAAVLAADACSAVGLEVPELSTETQRALRELAGPNAGVSNPLDLGGGASASLFAEAVRIAIADRTVDAVVAIMAPVAGVDSDDVARAVANADLGERPVVFVHLGSDVVPAPLRQRERPIPCFAFPERAIRSLGRIAEHSRWRAREPGHVPSFDDVVPGAAGEIVDRFLAAAPEGGWLPPADVHGVLAAFGIPLVSEIEVSSAGEAARAAADMGFPCVLKVVGEQLVHKADVGGVQLDLRSAAEARGAYEDMRERLGASMCGAMLQPMLQGVEMIAGVVSDPLFGPLVMFGTGGTTTELLGDRAFHLLPLTDVDAREIVRSVRGASLLMGYRGAPPCDLEALERVLLRLAKLAEEVPQLSELDLNPLMAMREGAVAVDARVRIVPWRHHAEQEVRRLR
jgi:acetyl coenzyme A synthetase (ADP forming)-like protein